jgi:hypothetical protein
MAEHLLLLLTEATSRDKWYTGGFLADFISKEWEQTISDVHIRGFVNYLRRQRHPILSSAKGYRYSTDVDELRDCIEDLKAREGAIREARFGLEEVLKHLIVHKTQDDLFGDKHESMEDRR